MLSSLNFLFLLSLGILSWTILCYIRQIEQFVDSNSNIKQEVPKTEIPLMAEPTHPQIMKPSISNHDNYNHYVNFFSICVCVYAVHKITYLAEMYLSKSIRHKMYLPTEDVDMKAPTTINHLQDQKENLEWKINNLERQNHEMKFKLKGAVKIHSPTSPDLEEQIHKIFINNKHIHLNRQIYVTQTGTLNMEFEKEKNPQPSVWEKYMETNNSTSRLSNEKCSIHMPVVMSREELENIKGIF